jgi:predicted nucleic acid-binding protein
LTNSFYLDASALAKRYVPEAGSALVDDILDKLPAGRIYVLNVGIGEVVSILVRKKNAGVMAGPDFGQVLLEFETEIVGAADIKKMPVGTRLAISSLALIVAHSINSTDAIILRSALAIQQKLSAVSADLVLVASDQRLLRAAQAEGLVTFDPESHDQATLAALIGP